MASLQAFWPSPALLAIFAVLPSGPGEADSAGSRETPLSAEDVQQARRVPADPMTLGAVDAPVVMVMWSNFQCPICGRFARETEPVLVRRYVEKDVLRIEWRDFPYIGPVSLPAAVAGRAAASQGRFWEFGAVVYSQQRRPRSSDFDASHLRAYAEQAGLNLVRFDADVTAQMGMAEAQADLAASCHWPARAATSCCRRSSPTPSPPPGGCCRARCCPTSA